MTTMAWTGRVRMTAAQWDDQNGSTVTFGLPMNKAAEDQRNPFHKYTKRRKGRAGTRFMGVVMEVVNDAQGPLVYKDEMMLAGWNDSQQNGHTVKFWLCADHMGHPFEGYLRKEDDFFLSLVELDDDNEPIDPKMRDRVEKQKVHPQSRRSVACAALCRNPAFWSWCQSNGYTLAGNDVVDEESAKLWFYLICNIDSRAHLDDPDRTRAIEEFDRIRKDFAATQDVPF